MSSQRNSVRLKNFFLPTLYQQYLSNHNSLDKTSNYIIVELFMIQMRVAAFGAKMIFDEDRIHTVTPEFRESGDF